MGADRYLDPVFGVAVGALSFYSYEQRVGREDGHTLKALLFRKFGIESAAPEAVAEASNQEQQQPSSTSK